MSYAHAGVPAQGRDDSDELHRYLGAIRCRWLAFQPCATVLRNRL